MPCVWEAILPALHICHPSVCVFLSGNCSVWALMDPAEPALEEWTGKEKRGLAHMPPHKQLFPILLPPPQREF